MPVKAGFHMSHFIVFHHISSEFRVYDQLGLIPMYENQPKQGILIHPNSSQFVAIDPSESNKFVFYDEIGPIPMNYDSRFSYNLTIAIMDIRQITMKSDEMRHMKTSLKGFAWESRIPRSILVHKFIRCQNLYSMQLSVSKIEL